MLRSTTLITTATWRTPRASSRGRFSKIQAVRAHCAAGGLSPGGEACRRSSQATTPFEATASFKADEPVQAVHVSDATGKHLVNVGQSGN